MPSRHHPFAKSKALVALLFLAQDLSPCAATSCTFFGKDYIAGDAIKTILKCKSDGTYDGHVSTCKGNEEWNDEDVEDVNCPAGETCVEDEESKAPECVVIAGYVAEEENKTKEGEDEEDKGKEETPNDTDPEQVQDQVSVTEDTIPNKEQEIEEEDQSAGQDPPAENEPLTEPVEPVEGTPDDIDSQQVQDQVSVAEDTTLNKEQDAAEGDQNAGQDPPIEDEPSTLVEETPTEGEQTPESIAEDTTITKEQQAADEDQSAGQDPPAEDESLTEQGKPVEEEPPTEEEPANDAEADQEQKEDNKNEDGPTNEADVEKEQKEDNKKQDKKEEGCVIDGTTYAIGDAINDPTNMTCLSEFSYQGLVATCGEGGNIVMETNGYDCPDAEMYCNQCDGIEMVVPCRNTENCTEAAPEETDAPVDVPYENENDCLVNYKAQDTIGYVGVRCIDNITMEVWKTKCFDDGTIGVDTGNEEQETCPTERPHCVPCGSERRAGAALCLETSDVPPDCEEDEFDPTTDLNDEPNEQTTEGILEDGDEMDEDEVSLVSDSSFDMDATRDSIRAIDSAAHFKSLCSRTKLISAVLCFTSALLFR